MKRFFIILCTVSTVFSINAQEKKVEKGNIQYGDLAYVDAMKTYLKVAEKGYKSKELFQKLGDSFYFNAKLKEANKWYTELFLLNEKVEAEYYYRYSQTLKSVENYKKADEYLNQFEKLSSSDIRASIYTNQKSYKEIIDKNSGRYAVKTTSINTRMSDYGTAFYGDKVLFSTSRDSIGVEKVRTKWTNHSFTNLYVSAKNDQNDLIDEEKFSRNLNSKFHEDTPVFTKDLKTVYFTRNNFNNGKIGRDDNKIINLKLYKATLNEKGEWGNIYELPFNSDKYSVAHPALSPDEKTLYFASNMPGSFGQSDLYKVTINGENDYGTPVNLGKGINTESRETFPFVNVNNELYFASDGHQGLGGLDIFVAKLDKGGIPSNVTNVGAPVNGPMDDFAFIIDESKKGFFSSNREGGKGSDDIYSFEENKPLEFDIKQELEGVVTDLETGSKIPGATVTLLDDKFNQIDKKIADDKGNFNFEVPAGKKYYVRAEKDEYDTTEKMIDVPNSKGKTTLKIDAGKKVREIKTGTDLAKTLNIKIIYFDLDKANIRKDAAAELAKIVEVMKQYPDMKIDVRSHTDCRQTEAYNLQLSDKRAKSTIAWIVKSGINANRVTGKGYGESQLVNDCGCEPTNQSSCSEEQHQANRRSEFIILKM